MAVSQSEFHDQLLAFFQEDLQRKKREEGWDEAIDAEMRTYSDLLSRSVRTAGPIPLQEIVERYQHLFGLRGPVHLERKILEAFPEREMRALGLTPLRMLRGLPRLYCQKQPALSKIKNHFAHLPHLLRTAAAKSIYSLYEGRPMPADVRVTILTYVLPDGWGDLVAGLEAGKVLEAAGLDVAVLAMSEKELPEEICWTAAEAQMERLRSSDLILQIPTVYPQTEQLRKAVEALASQRPLPKWEAIGEYGFIESDWFHPQSETHCMGLHFLEKGILIRKAAQGIDLESEALKEALFEGQSVDAYLKKSRFFLGYLFTEVGFYVYLHALLKSLEGDEKRVDICVPDAAKFFRYLERWPQVLDCPVGQVVVVAGSYLAVDKRGEGKTVRFICPDAVSTADFQRLLSFSSDFVGCRGDQSFSEVVSYNKGFFFDPRDHLRYFLQDIIALAENKIPTHRATLTILRLYAKVLEHNLPKEEGEWVDAISIQRQEPMELKEIADRIGLSLRDPEALVGFKKFNRMLAEEYSCNRFLLQMVQRAALHQRYPALEQLEKEQMEQFVAGRLPFASVIARLRSAI